MERTLSSIIKAWGHANLTSYGDATNIDPDDRPAAFSVLFDEAIAAGYDREDIEIKTKAILSYCIPENEKIRTDKFLFRILEDYIDVLDIKFPNKPSGLDFRKTSEKLTFYFKLKKTIKKKEIEIVKRSERALEDEDISDLKKEQVDAALSVSSISKEEKERLKSSLAESKIKKEIEEAEKILGDMYVLSPEEIQENFIPDLDPEVKELLGLNDKGEIA